jgi:DNA-directed RNA polymerase sigma subunit (sigma70/sigma32)
MTPATATSAALASLASALDETIADLARLLDRAKRLRAEVDAGQLLSEVMPREQRPLIITTLVDVTDRLHEAGGAVRRAEAQQLRAEGRTHEEIAEIFGVTRQRVAKLLRSPTVKAPSKRPAARRRTD